MKSVIKIGFFAVISTLSACGQFSITVAPSQVSLKSGAQQQFLVSESNAENPSGTWASTIGSIDASGVFTAPVVTSDQSGSISFTDTQNGKSAFALVTVISPFDGPAELPRTVPDSSMASTPAPGATTQVPAGGLQTALNSANCGDTLELEAGIAYSGSYTLPAKPCDDNHWIVIRTSAPDSVLPPEGTHINPCYAGVLSLPGRPPFTCSSSASLGIMAKIVAPKAAGAFTLAAGANHYRIGPGLEITRTVGTGLNYGLIIKDAKQPADHIIVDRDWVHGTAQDETTRGLFLAGVTYAAVVDSYFTDFHCTAGIGACIDSQAISGGSGPLPQGNWKIENNFLEGAAETILFGGVLHNSTTPADITITRNHLFKPLAWKAGQPGFVGGKETATATCPKLDPAGLGQCPFVVKNLFELKNAQRVLFEGNVLENVWAGFTQHGGTVVIEGANPCDFPTYSNISVVDITFRYNRVSHGASGFAFTNPGMAQLGTATPPNCPIANISAHDNLFDDLNADVYGDTTGTWDFELTDCPTCVAFHDIAILHNTEVVTASRKMLIAIGAGFSARPGFTFANNLTMVNAGLMVAGTGTSNLARINNLFASPVFAGNVLIGGTGIWPAGNFFPATPAAVMFENFNFGNGGDYHLLPVSPFAGKGIDGKDPGADISKVNAATQGVN